MKYYSLGSTGYAPVSHDPQIKKQVLVPEGFSCVRHLSHVVLRPGDTARVHAHADASEVFYCVRGRTEFSVSGGPVVVSAGSCLVLEPGEEHSISIVHEETELVYMLVAWPLQG